MSLASAILMLFASLAVYTPSVAAANIQDVVFTSQNGDNMALGTSLSGLTLSPWGPLNSNGHLYIESADRSALNLTLGGGLTWEKTVGFLGYAGLSGSAWVQMLSGSTHSTSMMPQAALSIVLEGSWTQGPFGVQSALSARSGSFDTSSFPILGVSPVPFSVAQLGATSRLQTVVQPEVGPTPGGWSWQTGGRYRQSRDRTYTLEMAAWHDEDSPSSAPGWRVFGGQELRGSFPGLWWTGLGVGTPYVSNGVADREGAPDTAMQPTRPALLLQVGTRQTLAPTSYGPVEVSAQLGTALRGSSHPLNSFAFGMETPLSATTRLSGAVQTTSQTLSPTLSLHFAPGSWEGGEVLLRWEQRVEHQVTTDSSIFLGLHVRP